MEKAERNNWCGEERCKWKKQKADNELEKSEDKNGSNTEW